jgi:hypothetical protein
MIPLFCCCTGARRANVREATTREAAKDMVKRCNKRRQILFCYGHRANTSWLSAMNSGRRMTASADRRTSHRNLKCRSVQGIKSVYQSTRHACRRSSSDVECHRGEALTDLTRDTQKTAKPARFGKYPVLFASAGLVYVESMEKGLIAINL